MSNAHPGAAVPSTMATSSTVARPNDTTRQARDRAGGGSAGSNEFPLEGLLQPERHHELRFRFLQVLREVQPQIVVRRREAEAGVRLEPLAFDVPAAARAVPGMPRVHE